MFVIRKHQFGNPVGYLTKIGTTKNSVGRSKKGNVITTNILSEAKFFDTYTEALNWIGFITSKNFNTVCYSYTIEIINIEIKYNEFNEPSVYNPVKQLTVFDTRD